MTHVLGSPPEHARVPPRGDRATWVPPRAHVGPPPAERERRREREKTEGDI
jgi:hypothetical protein